MKDPHEIILRPYITEKSVSQSYGDEASAQRRLRNVARAETRRTGKTVEPERVTESDLVRRYTFEVSRDANKLEIKSAIEAIYNSGKKPDEAIRVTGVRTMRVLGKKRRRTWKQVGYEADRKKAIITLAAGQILEDYGV